MIDSRENTDLYDPRPWRRVTLAEQRPVFEALAELATACPSLPAGFVTASSVTPGSFEVQADTLAALETWREALGVAPGSVRTVRSTTDLVHLEFRTMVAGVGVRVHAIGEVGQVPAAESEGGAA